MRFKKVFSNLEPEGWGRGIIMGVTGLLLLEPFYTIQTQKTQTFLGGVYQLLSMHISKAVKWPLCMKCGKGLLTNCVMKDVFRRHHSLHVCSLLGFRFSVDKSGGPWFFSCFIHNFTSVCVLSVYILAVCRYGVWITKVWLLFCHGY